MNIEKYETISDDYKIVFAFESKGRHGVVKKIVSYQQTAENEYNLAFGDINKNGNIDDKVITNNGDAVKVLATVVGTIFTFTKKYPDASIHIAGSTTERTKLYHRMIERYLPEIDGVFFVLGYNEVHGWISFKKNTKFLEFLLIRK